jgi:hypothetical protein
MGSRAATQSTQSQTTIQTDRRVGASNNANVATEGSVAVSNGSTLVRGNQTINSIDAKTISEALGLSRDVAESFADLARGVIDRSVDSVGDTAHTAITENSDVVQAGLDFAVDANREMADLASGAIDRTSDLAESTVTKTSNLAFDTTDRALDFGSDVTDKALDTVIRSLGAVSDATHDSNTIVDRNTAELSNAFNRFGEDLSKVQLAAVTGGASESTGVVKTVVYAAAGVAALFLFFRRN